VNSFAQIAEIKLGPGFLVDTILNAARDVKEKIARDDLPLLRHRSSEPT
jgi:hypothetical protein